MQRRRIKCKKFHVCCERDVNRVYREGVSVQCLTSIQSVREVFLSNNCATGKIGISLPTLLLLPLALEPRLPPFLFFFSDSGEVEWKR